MNGSIRAAEVCAINLCGWSLSKPEVMVNVVQNAMPPPPESVKRALCDMHAAVLAEFAARNGEHPPQEERAPI